MGSVARSQGLQLVRQIVKTLSFKDWAIVPVFFFEFNKYLLSKKIKKKIYNRQLKQKSELKTTREGSNTWKFHTRRDIIRVCLTHDTTKYKIHLVKITFVFFFLHIKYNVIQWTSEQHKFLHGWHEIWQ